MITVSQAVVADAPAILALQKLAYESEARLYNDWSLPPLTQSLESLVAEFEHSQVLKATLAGKLVGSVRAKVKAGTCSIGRLVVHPKQQGRGIGSQLLREMEARCSSAAKFELFTGSKSEANIRLYQRHGYTITGVRDLSATVSLTYLEKPARATA
jgi:ribosomal protein S18 acetylase RimI-like enzyme